MTPTLLLFVKVVLDSHDLLCFHVNFRIVFLLQWEMPSVLMEIALNPHITLTGKSILSTYLSNPRHSHRQQYVNMSHQRKADENHGEISLHRRKGLASVYRTHQWDWNWCSPSGNSVSVLHSTNYTRPTLSIYPDQVKSALRRDVCVPRLIAAFFTTAKRWEQCQCPCMDGWIHKELEHVHTHWNVIQP
jgi:hypothetical protein